MQLKYFLILIGSSCCTFLFAQQLSPSVLASNGGIDKAAGIQLEWTLGEPAVESQSSLFRNYTEGFHQPILVVASSTFAAQTGKEISDIPSFISLNPNPVTSQLTIHFSSMEKRPKGVRVLTAYGNSLLDKSLDPMDADVVLDLSNFVPGLYFMQFITSDHTTTPIYKIVKIQ